jgi:hypothetical protein
MAKPDIYSYITLCNRKGGEAVLKKAGYPKPKNPKEMADMLAHFVTRDGENALLEIAKIHPDRELLVRAEPELKKVENKIANADGDEESLNCSGCALAAAAIAADGTKSTTPAPVAKKGLNEKTINILILSGAAVLTVSLITMIVVASKKN